MTDPKPDFKVLLDDLLEEQSQKVAPLTPAELAAWRDGGQSEQERLALERRLIFDRAAVRELLQTTSATNDGDDAARSWTSFQAKLKEHQDPEEGPLPLPATKARRTFQMIHYAAAALALLAILLTYQVRKLEQENLLLVKPSLNVAEFTVQLGESGERSGERPIFLGEDLTVVRLDLSGSNVAYLSYQVALVAPDGTVVFQQQKSVDEQHQLTFSLHQGFLIQSGVYHLEISGLQNGERVFLKKLSIARPQADLERPDEVIRAQFKQSGEQVHAYRLDLKQGEFSRLEVEQNGIDIRLDLYSPQGELLYSLDAEPETVNVETLAFIAKSSGAYRLEITALDPAQEGDYGLSTDGARRPTATDLAQVAAQPHIVKAQEAWYADDWQTALNELETAHGLLKQAGEKTWQVRVLNKLGTISSRRELLAEAISYYDAALELANEPSLSRAELMRNKAYVYRFAGAFEQAVDLLKEAGRIEDKLGTDRSQAVWNNHMGTAYLKWGKAEEAIPYLEKAAEKFKSLEPIVRLRLAQAYLAMDIEAGERQQKYRKQALALLNGLLEDFEDWRPVVLFYRGQALELLGEPAAALEDLRMAAAAFADKKSQDELLNATVSIARVELKLNRREAAKEKLDEALVLLDEALASDNQAFLSKNFLASRYQVIDLMADLVLSGDDEGEWAQLLTRLDGFRAKGLLEALAPTKVEEDPATAEIGQALREHINRTAWQLTTANPSKEQADELEGALALALITYNQRFAPVPHPAQEHAAPALSLAKAQRLLEHDDLLLYFVMGESRAWLLALDRGQLRRFDLGARQVVERDVRSYIAKLGRRQNRPDPGFKAMERQLADLVPPALLATSRAKRLMIVADGVLQDLPFAALVDPQGRPLIERWAMVYLPSLATLASIKARRATTPTNGKLFVMAAPEQSDPIFGDLPFALQEAGRIAALMPSAQTVSAAAAHRGQVSSAEFKTSQIVHFATHGLFHPKHYELSALVLADVDEQGQARDPFLRVADIAQLELSAKLVVLSACETGQGEHIRGEGLLGLPSAFLQAGAASVLASLWRIDDQATMVLMEQFYRNLKDNDPAKALQLAQKSMARSEKWSAPYYWAGFRLVGEAEKFGKTLN